MTHCDEVGEMLSGYVDGELTQASQQRVRVHVETCENCKETLADLTAIREKVQALNLGEMHSDEWEGRVKDAMTTRSRNIGWMLFVGGVGVLCAYGVWAFLTDDSVSPIVRVAWSAMWGGLATLFLSVLRERLIKSKDDKYNDVEI